MSTNLSNGGSIQVVAGEVLVLRMRAYDPTGISRVFIQCFPFSITNSNKVKVAYGELEISPDESLAYRAFDVGVAIPEDAVIGKWGVQLVEFTDGRGYKKFFYRGQ